MGIYRIEKIVGLMSILVVRAWKKKKTMAWLGVISQDRLFWA